MIKKITLLGVMAVLCLNFLALAQENKAIDVTLKGIQIGQKVPDVTLTSLHNYKDKNGKPATTAKLSDFTGKLILLDFWATWCSPCVAMIPKMDSLQKVFGDKIQFLSVTYQTEKEVLPFLENLEKQRGKHYDLPVVTGEKELHQLFPHITLPHYVWIDGSGVVRAITESNEVNRERILEALSGKEEMSRKSDFKIAYDGNKPFLIDGNGGNGWNMKYHSILTDYTEGIASGFTRTPFINKAKGTVTVRNSTLLQMYQIAYGGYNRFYGPNKVVLKFNDKIGLRSKITGRNYTEWLKNGHGYCYELIVPPNLNGEMFELMKRDLKNLFPEYSANAEKRKVKCLVLKRTSSIDKLKSNGGKPIIDFSGLGFELKNSVLPLIPANMEIQFMQNCPYPIVDGTDYKGRVDIKVESKLSDLKALNEQLAKYDLKFEVDDYVTDVIVIDNKSKPTNTK
ncbi:thiol-disulfide isomerase/thioredoxin [Pedobacter sp. UYP30]|uniref:TlpA family protein disulfide reductase n=1 Tax=Pedobacter sp. UYP30 TaxID=1756400 RepID=UPI003399CD83